MDRDPPRTRLQREFNAPPDEIDAIVDKAMKLHKFGNFHRDTGDELTEDYIVRMLKTAKQSLSWSWNWTMGN